MTKDTPVREGAPAIEHPDDTDYEPMAEDATDPEPAPSGESDEPDTPPTAEELDEAAPDPGQEPVIDEGVAR